MAIQYSSGSFNYNNTFTCTVGTRAEIVTGIENALNAAGWTTISGHGTGNVLVESATSPSPQSLVMRANLFDPGSGNCAQIKVRNQANTHSQSNYLPLLPAASKVFRVIANEYQAFIFTSSSPSTAREFAAFGIPYIPSFLQGVITECIWAMGNGQSDTDTTLRASFRTGLTGGGNNVWPASWYDVNGNVWEVFNSNPGSVEGEPQLFAQCGSQLNNVTTVAYRWHDDSLVTYEPVFAWGLTANTDEPKVRGQLWDCAIVNDGFTADQTTSFDSHNWWLITNSNTGSTGSVARGTLLHVVP